MLHDSFLLICHLMREPSHVYTAKGIIQSRHNAIWRGLGLAVGCRFWPDAVNPGT